MVRKSEEAANILVIDDDAPIRDALSRVLTKLGHEVQTAGDGDAALEILRSGKGVELVLLDVRMPGKSGIDVVTDALEIDAELAIIMLSGLNDATTASICMQRGAIDYLTKPIRLSELSEAVGRALRRRHTTIQNREISSWLREEVEQRTKELEVERRKLVNLTVATLETLVNALEAKDAFLSGHSARVASLSATIAAELNLSDDEVERVRTAGRLHDLGKIGTREAVLNKEGELTPEEYDHVKQHVVIGSQILAPLTHLTGVTEMVRHHHERWDGTGYPDGLEGEAIPLGARIIGTAEVYDALTTPRAYQQEVSPETAVERMRTMTGSVLDPRVMDALDAVVGRKQTLVFIEDA